MFKMGDYTNCQFKIAEIVDGDYVICTVSQDDAQMLIDIINENEEMKFGKFASKVELGDYTVCRYNIAEIVDEYDDVVCTVATDDVETVIGILEENKNLKNQ